MPERQSDLPIQPVDKPIICKPYDEPREHWQYDRKGHPSKAAGRRRAGYFYKTERTGSQQLDLLADEQWDDLPMVNALRDDVARWRESGYRGASQVTRDLLAHWRSPSRARRLFFCQIEAVETVIYLAELRLRGRSSRTGFQKFQLTDADIARLLKGDKPTDLPLSESASFFPTLVDRSATQSLAPFTRLACKMATGSGKTVVMGMLISWAFCNRGQNPESIEYPIAALVVCPNLTVKERLQVLRPESESNYYAEFDLVPVKYRPFLQRGKVLITNWHVFSPESAQKDGDRSYKVVNKGPETPETLARRVLEDLYDLMPIMVLNDEGHHCWRPAPDAERLTTEEKKELEEEKVEATVWIEGLDWINSAPGGGVRGVSFCVDLSATPFYIKGSGHPEGHPFPWIVSDFGLIDAIESGIVKIPRLPVTDTAGKTDDAGRPDPRYFRLWKNMTQDLKASEKVPSGKPKADVAYREAEAALKQIAGQWRERFRQVQAARPEQEQIPPVLIVVCDNTDIAQAFYRKISGETESEEVTEADVEGSEDDDAEEAAPKARSKKSKLRVRYGASSILQELANTADRKHTIRIDSKLLAEAESGVDGKSRQTAAEELRRVVSTVGKRGEPGEHVRCVVSVAMLTEGWDANNVTHILGVRAFGSQLLCEQVVGRGLRRMNYDPDPTSGLLTEEYVDVYGIPFSVIPFKGRPVDKPEPDDKPRNHVRSLPEREHLEIRFPIVEGYVFALKKNVIKCDVKSLEPLDLNPNLEPELTYMHPTAGYHDHATAKAHPFEIVKQSRDTYYAGVHFQTIQFQAAQAVIERLLAGAEKGQDAKARVLRLQSRHQLFPQVYSIVKAYTEQRIRFHGLDPREVGLERYFRPLVQRIADNIEPDTSAGEAPVLPVLNRYRPVSSTSGVDFFTTRPVKAVTRSHVNAVVMDSGWEGHAADILDACAAVECFARNDHMGLVIQYGYLDVDHDYTPDFVVRLTNALQVVVEVKGYMFDADDRVNEKNQAAKKWVAAVNNLGDFGTWEFLICHKVEQLPARLEELAKRAVSAPVAV